MEFYDVLIAGGGAAGMACALTLQKTGKSILLAEREAQLGGVLKQCVHSGFGRAYFGREMTGTAYAEAFTKPLLALAEKEGGNLAIRTDTMILKIFPDRTAVLSSGSGISRVGFDKLILATGCRERSLYSRLISGSRPAGILTCGMAQRMMNVEGREIEGPVVILGTGDIGQIMARQLKQNNIELVCMIEQNDHPGGRRHNQKECLEAYDIPLLLHSTIVRICGKKRLEAVIVRDLYDQSEKRIACRTLLTAIGLIPETELASSFLEDPAWLIRAGNCRYVHDIVDSVTVESERLSAALFS